MIIEKIEIESFAAIKNLSLSLSDKINLIEGSNESGKSSIASFIKFVLYGVSGKGTDGHLSERKKAINYSESHAGGSLVVRIGEKRYKITRNTAVSGTVRESARTRFTLRDLESGADISDGREPGEQLLGISESVFVRSAYLRQGDEGGIDGSDIHSAISNILFSGDERLSVEKAVERIDAARIPLSHKHGEKGRIFALREQISLLSEQLKCAVGENEEIIALSLGIEEREKANREHIKKYNELKNQARACECARALESFNALSRAEAEKVKAELSMLEYKAAAHIPADEEMEELRAFEISLSTLNVSLSDTEAQKEKLLLEKEKLNTKKGLGEAVENAGGAETLLGKVQKTAAAVGRFAVLFVTILLLCGISAASAFVLKPYISVFLAVSALMGALGIIFLVLFVSKKLKLKKLLRECDCKTAEELGEAVKAYEGICMRMKINEQNLASIDEREAEYKSLIKAEQSRFCEFLHDMDIDDKVSDSKIIPKITEELKARQKKCAELEAEASRTKAFYEGLLSKTESLDAEKLKAELASLGVDEPLLIDMEKTAKSMSFYREQSALLEEKIHAMQIQLATLRATRKPPSEIKEQISELSEELSSSEEKLAVYILARDSLISAAEELRKSIAPTLARAAGEYMDTLTGGKYKALSLDSSFTLSYEADGETRHIDYMSEGSKQSAYLCLRLALSDVISKKGALPIILDEAAAHLDDTRAIELLKLLGLRAEKNIQHILFTCHGREKELLSKAGYSYNYIKL